MHHSRISCHIVLFIAVSAAFAAGVRGQTTAAGQSAPAKTASLPKLGENQASVRAIVLAGRLDSLRWPNFSDYRVHVDNFYRPSAYALAWIHDGQPTPQSVEVIRILQEAEGEGLFPEDYDAPRWRERTARLQNAHTPADEARFDVALTVSLMRYISDLRIGKINPRYFKFGLDISRKKLDLPLFLRQRIVHGTDLSAALATIEPPISGYKRMRAALLKYIELAKNEDEEKVPDPVFPVLAGNRYDYVARLAKRLRLLGDLPENAAVPADSQVYEGALVEAVKSFQRRHGLPQSGQFDSATAQELNVPLRDRVQQIRLALERFRWVRYEFSQPPIIVNIPEFRLYGVDEQGQVALTINVNVGEAYDFQTPVFENAIKYLVFRPYWNPPPNILRNEIIPELREVGSLDEDDLELVTSGGQVIKTGRVTEAMLQQVRAGKVTVRQPPGPDNALGLVKFIFPNEHSVYLHDTPQSVDMFSKDERAYSHGCIHVQEPAKLAAWLLRHTPGWDLARVEHAMRKGRDNYTVNLQKPIPLLIFYATALVRPNGEIYFFRDIYGHDAALQKTLAKGYPYPG